MTEDIEARVAELEAQNARNTAYRKEQQALRTPLPPRPTPGYNPQGGQL